MWPNRAEREKRKDEHAFGMVGALEGNCMGIVCNVRGCFISFFFTLLSPEALEKYQESKQIPWCSLFSYRNRQMMQSSISFAICVYYPFVNGVTLKRFYWALLCLFRGSVNVSDILASPTLTNLGYLILTQVQPTDRRLERRGRGQ